MTLTLQLGNEPLGAVETFELRRAFAPDGATETWMATLALNAPTPALAEQAVAALQDRVGESGPASLKAGEGAIRALDGCRHGPRLAAVKALAPMPEAAHGTRRVQLTIEATLQEGVQSVQSHALTVQAVHVAGAPQRLIARGRIILRAGEIPALHEGEVAPPAAGFRRVRSAITRDAAEPALDYEVEDEQVFAPLPAGVSDGQVIRTLHVAPDGRRVQVTSGFFAGPGALARAQELQPAGASEVRLRENPHARRVDFEFHELLQAAAGVLARSESVSFATIRRVVDHALLAPGLPVYRQQIGAPFSEITQEGSAAGASAHPAPPSPMFAADLIERRVQYSVPDGALPPERRWVTTWRYLMRTRAETAAVAP